MMPRVLVVDDHTVLSQALADALSLHGLGNVRVAAPHQLEPESLLALVDSDRPDVVLLDLFLGQGNVSLPLIPRLRATGSVIVVLTASEDRSVWAQALEAGAAGVLPKSAPFDVVVEAVHRAAAGQPLLSDRERSDLLDTLAESRQAEEERLDAFTRLTPREQEVLAGLIAGTPVKGIARDLGVSLPTVRTHIRSLFDKLGVNSQRAAVTLALREGWKPGLGR
jgi:two-component system, NarL family, nitrate/nitrite response regulator NarL